MQHNTTGTNGLPQTTDKYKLPRPTHSTHTHTHTQVRPTPHPQRLTKTNNPCARTHARPHARMRFVYSTVCYAKLLTKLCTPPPPPPTKRNAANCYFRNKPAQQHPTLSPGTLHRMCEAYKLKCLQPFVFDNHRHITLFLCL